MMDHARLNRRPPAWLVFASMVCGCGGAASTSHGGSGGDAGIDQSDGGGEASGGAGGRGSMTPLDGAATDGDAAPADAAPGNADADAAPGNADADAAPGNANADAAPGNGVPTFVAVGYGGVRVRSLDLGKTWIDSQRLGGGGDDNYLLRTIAFGKGLFVALGWQLHTSPDGKAWTMRAKDAGQWMGGVRFGNGMFVAAGGYGESTYSMDGLTWPKGGGRMTDAARSVAFGNGLWVARADSNHWWQTSTGQTWTDLGGTHMDDVVFCDNQFVDAKTCAAPAGRDGGRVAFGANVWVGIRDGKLERSEDGGATWKTVYTASDALEDVAFGSVVP